MRLSVNLADDLYLIAKALAQAEGCSLSEAVNRLVRRGLVPALGPRARGGFPVVRGSRPFSAEDVRRVDEADER